MTMGLLDEIGGLLGSVAGGAGTGRAGDLLSAAAGLLTNPQTGGLAGLADLFRSKGLGTVVDSWIGTGGNIPVSADQITKVLGDERLKAVAAQAGIPMEMIAPVLAQVLPTLVDKVTPNGTIPAGDLLKKGIEALKGRG